MLLVNGDPRSVGWQDELFYLERALNPSARSKSGVTQTVVSVDGLSGQPLEDHDVVVLANVEKLPRTKVAELRTFVKNGGGLLFTTGSLVKPEVYNSLFADLLPKPLRSLKQLARKDDPDAPLKVTRMRVAQADHPVFKVFNLPGGEGLNSVQVFSYMLLQPTLGEGSVTTLSYSDGAAGALRETYRRGSCGAIDDLD